ncbi:MAG: hypothetical protein U0792_02025 [Gemmataceae bacterium]
MPYRQGATRILLLITDAPPKIREVNVEAAAAAVKAAGIDSAHLVIQRFDHDVYKPLLSAGTGGIPGKYFNLGDVVRGDEGFDGLLDTFGKVVTAAAFARNTETKPVVAPPPDPPKVAAAAAATPRAAEAAPAPTIPSLQSREGAAAGSEKRVVVRSGVWAGPSRRSCVWRCWQGNTITFAERCRHPRESPSACLAGLSSACSAAAGQALYLVKPALGFQVLGWTLLGGLAGAGLSAFIPNMKWFLGLAGGALGGAVGAIGFLIASRLDETAGRLAGGLLLGFCIGLMVAIVEAAFRRAWLEVRFGERETILVNLGPEPVKIGGDSKMCTVWARGAAPLALRFFVRDGSVICDDAVMKREGAVAEGFSKEVGNVTVTVRTGATTAPAVPARPAPTPAKAVPAKRTVEDDYDSLPMPLSPPPTKSVEKPAQKPIRPAAEAPLSLDDEPAPPAKPLPTKPATVAPPAPVRPAPKPPAPKASPKPASAPSAAKSEDACPSCGRVNAGKPKQRYCMVCDETY